jgi:hypothetical protein
MGDLVGDLRRSELYRTKPKRNPGLRVRKGAKEMNKGATDHVLTIVRLLAKGADDSRLSPNEVDLLNQNVTALIQQDRDDLVRAFLTAVKDAEGVLTPNVARKLASYPQCKRSNPVNAAALAQVGLYFMVLPSHWCSPFFCPGTGG